MKPALLVVDVQNSFFDRNDCRPFLDDSLVYINGTANLFRQAGLPVFFIQDEEVGGGPGSPGHELFAGLERSENDPVISKKYGNSFWKTDLEDQLKQKGVNFVVVSGFAAGQCVTYTYNGAQERGFRAALLQNGIAGFKERHIQLTYELCDVISYFTLEAIIGPQR